MYIVGVKWLLLIALAVSTPCLGQGEPSLQKTIEYMASMLEDHGQHQEILFGSYYQDKDHPCNLFISDRITDVSVKPEKVYSTEVQFELSAIDPDSVKASTTKEGTRVGFETTNYKSVIWTRVGKWSDPVSKSKGTAGRIAKGSIFTRSTYGFTFPDSGAADHFSKAFRHAIEVCGGKGSAF